MKELRGVVASAGLYTLLEGVEVERADKFGQILEKTSSNKSGKWKIKRGKDGEKVYFKKKGYVTKNFNVNAVPEVVRILEDSLIGYQDKLWFVPDEKVNVYIHAPKNFFVKIFRHGLKKECVLDLGLQESSSQNIPDGFFVDSGLNWKKTITYQIPLSAKPGIYSVSLDSEGQERFSIPFVLSSPGKKYGHSKILVLASTNNWQTYNLWGGRSRYRNFEGIHTPDFIKFFFFETIC